MSFVVVIPARYASTRLPGKLLRPIAGKPLLQYTYEQAQKSGAQRIFIATDDQRIADAANGFSAEVVLTSEGHPSGTDRIAELVEKMAFSDNTVVVNVQGDEPLIPPENIQHVAGKLADATSADMTTLCIPIKHSEELFNPNVVKVVLDNQGYALYFSRSTMPWNRDAFPDNYPGFTQKYLNSVKLDNLQCPYYRHIGLYAYRAGFLKRYVKLPPSALEKAEALEQLRVLSNGFRIQVVITTDDSSIGVDTEADLQRVRAIIESNVESTIESNRSG